MPDTTIPIGVFRLVINTENDAFQPMPTTEVARLLRAIADRIEGIDDNGDYRDRGWAGHYQTILDINGNDVGRYAFKRTQDQ